MSANVEKSIDVDLAAMKAGGVLFTLPWSSKREELRISVRINENGARHFHARVWFLNDAGVWCPSRKGWLHLGVGDALRLGQALTAAADAAPSREGEGRRP